MDYPAPVERLIDELRKLPGVGPKSAQRIAFYLLRGTKDDAGRLAEAIGTLLDGIRTCAECNSVTDRELCQHCSDPARSARTICRKIFVARSGGMGPLLMIDRRSCPSRYSSTRK